MSESQLQKKEYRLECGNSKELLKTLESNSIDSIVTDPPYELGFMGKKWDNTGIAYDVELWAECLRVLKHGGHLLAFSGSRTYHRMTVAIEDAGFDIRDQIQWVYGSGFPKSHNISKGIDKSDAVEMRRQRDLKFTEWMRSTGITGKHINDLTQSNMGNHYLTDKEQPAVATAEMFDKLRPFLPEVPEWVEQMVRERTVESENFKKREVVGSKKSRIGTAFGEGEWASGQAQDVDITAPATEAAKQWDGWGTALKPAHEPICVARKPLIGTVAENVLTHGTGGINVDGCRVGGLGRWPANFIHDGSEEVLAGFPETVSKWGISKPREKGKNFIGFTHNSQQNEQFVGDKGSASRFFYCAKASKKDRDEGCEGIEVKTWKDQGFRDNETTHLSPRAGAGRTSGSANHHPTVKPTSLMQYLCRLVTPPNGTILDPFLGSGSTGKAALYEGFNFVGFDLQSDYIDIAKARIEFAIKNKNNTLFDNE
jgi:DNA modification methylase